MLMMLYHGQNNALRTVLLVLSFFAYRSRNPQLHRLLGRLFQNNPGNIIDSAHVRSQSDHYPTNMPVSLQSLCTRRNSVTTVGHPYFCLPSSCCLDTLLLLACMPPPQGRFVVAVITIQAETPARSHLRYYSITKYYIRPIDVLYSIVVNKVVSHVSVVASPPAAPKLTRKEEFYSTSSLLFTAPAAPLCDVVGHTKLLLMPVLAVFSYNS